MARKMEVQTYFSHSERMFPHLEDGKIPTGQFLQACQGIADFVGKEFIIFKISLVKLLTGDESSA